MEKGEKKAKIEIAKKSLKQGLDIETIKLITDLTTKEIEEIRENEKRDIR
jgi:predicted transposase/invertase (TIGR01784 family)